MRCEFFLFLLLPACATAPLEKKPEITNVIPPLEANSPSVPVAINVPKKQIRVLVDPRDLHCSLKRHLKNRKKIEHTENREPGMGEKNLEITGQIRRCLNRINFRSNSALVLDSCSSFVMVEEGDSLELCRDYPTSMVPKKSDTEPGPSSIQNKGKQKTLGPAPFSMEVPIEQYQPPLSTPKINFLGNFRSKGTLDSSSKARVCMDCTTPGNIISGDRLEDRIMKKAQDYEVLSRIYERSTVFPETAINNVIHEKIRSSTNVFFTVSDQDIRSIKNPDVARSVSVGDRLDCSVLHDFRINEKSSLWITNCRQGSFRTARGIIGYAVITENPLGSSVEYSEKFFELLGSFGFQNSLFFLKESQAFVLIVANHDINQGFASISGNIYNLGADGKLHILMREYSFSQDNQKRYGRFNTLGGLVLPTSGAKPEKRVSSYTDLEIVRSSYKEFDYVLKVTTVMKSQVWGNPIDTETEVRELEL